MACGWRARRGPTLETQGHVVSTVVTPLESSISISSRDAPKAGKMTTSPAEGRGGGTGAAEGAEGAGGGYGGGRGCGGGGGNRVWKVEGAEGAEAAGAIGSRC